MNKKFLGIKLSVYLTAFLCLIAAFLLWLFVNISGELSNTGSSALVREYIMSIC